MTECATMEDDKEMHEAFLRMSRMVDIINGTYEKIREEDKGRFEIDASSTSSNAYASYSLPSSYSHPSNEEVN